MSTCGLKKGPSRLLLETLVRRTAQCFSLVDRHPGYFLPLWILAYCIMVTPVALRPLWFDELHTYYIAISPTMSVLVDRMLHVDLNPPLSYLAVRTSVAIFGDSPFAVRLPSMAAFLVAGLVAYRIARERLGGGYALLALGLTWSFGMLPYAAEARPYALVLGFFSLAVLCWLRATEQTSWRWLGGLSLSVAGMLLSHCLAAFFVAAIGIGELAKTIRRKRIDWRIWLALVSATPVIIMYVPLLRNSQSVLQPFDMQAGPGAVAEFYWLLFSSMGMAQLLLLFAVAVLNRPSKAVRDFRLLSFHEATLGVTCFVAPIGIIFYFIHAKGMFHPRYGAAAILVLSLAICILLAHKTDRSPSAGALAAIFVLVNISGGTILHSHGQSRATVNTQYRSIQPDLPLVSANGLAFLEMDHDEPPDVVRRLYYLTDREAAVRHAHSTVFEGMASVRQLLPVRAKVEPYRTFVSQHCRFLVFSAYGYSTDWLLAQLKADGGHIRSLGQMATSYREGELLEANLCVQRNLAPAVETFGRRTSRGL